MKRTAPQAPMTCAVDAAQAPGAVLRAVAEGDLTPAEGASIMALMCSQKGAARNSAISGNTKRILEALIQSGGAGFTVAR
jgi:hypothetical protein